MTLSARRKVSPTIGSVRESAESMLTYCEPWPV